VQTVPTTSSASNLDAPVEVACASADTRSAPTSYDAVLFDMDVVVTDTASAHAQAWLAPFDEALPHLADAPVRRFDPVEDYRRLVDGRTRQDGVRAVLSDRGLAFTEGNVEDGPSVRSVSGLAARKRELFSDLLAKRVVLAHPDTLKLLRRLRDRGVPLGLATSSRNGREMLSATGLSGLFDVVVDGHDAAVLGLAGKPDPAVFLEVARQLGATPDRSMVVEDAAAGVQAGVAGGFGWVVGVARTGNGAGLLASGADVVLDDLDELELTTPADVARICGRPSSTGDPWLLVYDDADQSQEGTREALCTLGNGFWATRGAALGVVADGTHYPGTYLAGVYNRLTTDLEGHKVDDEHLVNAPDWASLTLLAAGTFLAPDSPSLVSVRRELDLRRGALTSVSRYRQANGNTTRVTARKLVSMATKHLAGWDVEIEAENWTGPLVVRSGIDGRVHNRNVAEYAALSDQHLTPVAASEVDKDTVVLDMATTQSGVHIALAARTRFHESHQELLPPRRSHQENLTYIGHEVTLTLTAGRPLTIEKIVGVATSREPALSTAALAAIARVSAAPSFGELLEAHTAAWAVLWERFAISIDGGQHESLALNVNTFHVLQTVAAADADLDAGLPARGLHGEGYRGHIFWDELFVYPMLTLRQPAITRALLLYRCRRLPAAQAAARAAGFQGAMFPWQSGSDGREETPTELFNTRTGTWMPDNSRRQRHVGLAVAYSIWQYQQATGDLAFLTDHGLELMVEVSRFFTSLATYDASADRYDIDGVMGPDEFHDGPPGNPGVGVRNNAYTNVLTAWVLTRTAQALDLITDPDSLGALRRLHVTEPERARWEHMSRRLRVPFHPDGVISQFEGYEQLPEFDWQRYRDAYGDIGRLDLILHAEGDSPNNYKLAKQADVLMLLYLFSAEELRIVLEGLGYALPAEAVRDTAEFYLARTSNGSTLSRLVQGWVMIRADRARSWSLFTQTLASDLDDIQTGTTREGVHLGAMAGTVDLLLRGYAGVETRDAVLRLHPELPDELTRAIFEIAYHGQPIRIELTPTRVRLSLHSGSHQPTKVCIEGQERSLLPGQHWDVALAGAPVPGSYASCGHAGEQQLNPGQSGHSS
jgi:HAD superfamily hydrolase (TIGR01509 family)